ncbi:MAG: GIY-YIG nuclease family protein [Acidobacteriaceae bacterium]|nr:GIY-YIG nuclease family protein [Acidobacteriaceae bacterium]
MAWKRSSVRTRPGPPALLNGHRLHPAERDRRKFYIGCTSDLSARLQEHQRGQTTSTCSRGPWKLVFQDEFETLAEARRRERQLKSWKSHRSIQELITLTRQSG